MTFFGLKQGQDLEDRAAHPHQEFAGGNPPPGHLPYLYHDLQALFAFTVLTCLLN